MRFITFFILFFTLIVARADEIKVGITPFSPPFIMGSDNKGHYTGFDSELINEICRRINAQCEFKPMKSYLNFFDEILNDSVDIGIGGVTITAEREKVYIFSLPYLTSSIRYMTYYNSKINSIDDIRGKVLGITSGTIFPSIAKAQFGDSITIKYYKNNSLMLDALANEEIDATLLDGPNAIYWDSNNNKTYKLVGKTLQMGLGYGIIANNHNQDIIKRINEALLAMQTDGSYLKIYNTYFSVIE